jgi:predicted nuclease of predicted toxin-antitoxin system
LKLICDANVGSRIARALSSEGHDVVRAIHVTPGAKDDEVLAYAVANEHVLITCDRDFGELVFQRGAPPPPAIIYVRFEPEDVLDIIPRIIPLLDFDRLKGHMTVVGDEHDRRTPFPQKS